MILHKSFLTKVEAEALVRLANSGVFEPGRQGTGYEKLSIMTEETLALRHRCLEALNVPVDNGHDAYILRYLEGSYIPPHKDDAPLSSEHRRINCVIKSPARGGDLYVEGVEYPLTEGDAYVFRPDLQEHEVTRIEAGIRLVFSVGTLA